MFAQVRAFSSLTRVVQAPAPTSRVLSVNSTQINGTTSEPVNNQKCTKKDQEKKNKRFINIVFFFIFWQLLKKQH